MTTNGLISNISAYLDFNPNGEISTNYYGTFLAVFHNDLVTNTLIGGWYFRESASFTDIEKANGYVRELFPTTVPFNATSMMIFTWYNTRQIAYGSSSITMQAVLVRSESVNVVLYLYIDMDVYFANQVVGVTIGDGTNYKELCVSRTPDVRYLDDNTQVSTPGLYGFLVEPGQNDTVCQVTVILVDECALDIHNCSVNANCVDTEDSFECTCNDGYEGNGVTCTVLMCPLECDSHYAEFPCQHTFINCSLELILVDECALEMHNCSANANCVDTEDSFECTCNDGYEGNGVTCTDIDECALETDTCTKYERCNNKPGTYECVRRCRG